MKRLITTRKGNSVVLAICALIGLVAVVLIKDDNIGALMFVSVTSLEAWAFTLIFALKSTWRANAVSRAVLLVFGSYALLSAHITTSLITGYRPAWMIDIRQLLYLGFGLAIANITLAMVRNLVSPD